MRLGVVGATGMVGEEFLKLMNQRNFKAEHVRLFASDKSAGTKLQFQNKSVTVETLSEGCFDDLDLVFFSSGDDISKEWAPKAVKAGAFAVDNSGAFRMDENTILCVPEVNGDILPNKNNPQIIANPNCSTIQLVMALKPLDDAFRVSEVRVSTYQAVSGAGKPAEAELKSQIENPNHEPKYFPQAIAFNCIPQIGSIDDEGFCTEESKIMRETKKILRRPDLKISAWTVRVPVINGHSEAAWVTLERPAKKSEITTVLNKMPGVEVIEYPTALSSSGRDPVFIGRIHQDLDFPKTWMMWIVADNIRKGAALNGIQIAERIFDIS